MLFGKGYAYSINTLKERLGLIGRNYKKADYDYPILRDEKYV